MEARTGAPWRNLFGDFDPILHIIKVLGAEAITPSKSDRLHPRKLRKKTYRKRHRVENAFCSIKRFRSVATRYEKLSLHYAGIVALAWIMMWL